MQRFKFAIDSWLSSGQKPPPKVEDEDLTTEEKLFTRLQEGLLVFAKNDRQGKGRVVFGLDELPLQEVFVTEKGTEFERTDERNCTVSGMTSDSYTLTLITQLQSGSTLSDWHSHTRIRTYSHTVCARRPLSHSTCARRSRTCSCSSSLFAHAE